MKAVIEALCRGVHLSAQEAEAIFADVVRGAVPEIELAALLVALKAKGETPDEVAGAARALWSAAVAFERPDYVFADSCGTGGDGQGTINVSTAVAFVAAEAGLPVAKHGNRSVSSRSGSADVLESLGARVEVAPAIARRALDDDGFCFLFAPQYQPGLRHAMGVRRALGVRTVMNLLGPLVNPARPPVQLMGVYDPARVTSVARTLGLLGCRSALVVHGRGLDEIALHAPTIAARLQDGEVTEIELDPGDAGVEAAPIEALRGGTPAENAASLAALLQGRGSRAQADAVAINAGALLWIAGLCKDLRDGTSAARDILASGRGHERMQRFVARTHAPAEEAARGKGTSHGE